MRTIKMMLAAIVILLIGRELTYLSYTLGGDIEVGIGIRIGACVVAGGLTLWAVIQD